jgi:hypothetical protein
MSGRRLSAEPWPSFGGMAGDIWLALSGSPRGPSLASSRADGGRRPVPNTAVRGPEGVPTRRWPLSTGCEEVRRPSTNSTRTGGGGERLLEGWRPPAAAELAPARRRAEGAEQAERSASERVMRARAEVQAGASQLSELSARKLEAEAAAARRAPRAAANPSRTELSSSDSLLLDPADHIWTAVGADPGRRWASRSRCQRRPGGPSRGEISDELVATVGACLAPVRQAAWPSSPQLRRLDLRGAAGAAAAARLAPSPSLQCRSAARPRGALIARLGDLRVPGRCALGPPTRAPGTQGPGGTVTMSTRFEKEAHQ